MDYKTENHPLAVRRERMSDDYKTELIYLGTGTTQSPGGQHAGSPPSAVRITHVPTGIMAQCGEHRSQHKNRITAMEMVHWGLISCGYPTPSPTQGG